MAFLVLFVPTFLTFRQILIDSIPMASTQQKALS